MRLLITAILAFLFVGPVQAREAHYGNHHYLSHSKYAQRYNTKYSHGISNHIRFRRNAKTTYYVHRLANASYHQRKYKIHSRVYHRSNRVVYRDGRPRAWCGWAMRQWFGVTNTAFNLAANWVHYGRPTYPHEGAVVVWRHHVGYIVGPCNNGRCVVKSGNYNNRVAVVSMNVRNAIAFRE